MYLYKQYTYTYIYIHIHIYLKILTNVYIYIRRWPPPQSNGSDASWTLRACAALHPGKNSQKSAVQ